MLDADMAKPIDRGYQWCAMFKKGWIGRSARIEELSPARHGDGHSGRNIYVRRLALLGSALRRW